MLRRARPLPHAGVIVVLVGLLALVTGCGGDAEPRAGGPLPADAFAAEAEKITGGTVELSAFADQDLVVWFWSPW